MIQLRQYWIVPIERGGRSIKSTLVKTNPTRTIGCSETNCLPCKTGKGDGGDCRKTSIGYEIDCAECLEVKSVVYHGETSASAYVRGQKHLKDYKYKIKSFSLYKHAQADHQGRMDVGYRMKVKTKFTDAMTRQVNEGVRISRCQAEVSLNSKSEWHGPATVRLVVDN